jgi:hypothetical protein
MNTNAKTERDVLIGNLQSNDTALAAAGVPGLNVGSVIVRERLRQHLQRHMSVELRIPRPIHLPHAAFADLGGDGIRAEGGARLE